MSEKKQLIVGILLIALFSFSPASFADTVSYGYDDFGRLTAMTSVDAVYLTKISYLYDNIGNFTNQSATVGILVNMPDSKLKTAVNSALGKNATDPLTRTDLASLTALSAAGKGISDLTGLEWAVNLTSLDLRNNNISSIEQLAGLTKLVNPLLDGNPIPSAAVPGMGQFGFMLAAVILMLLTTRKKLVRPGWMFGMFVVASIFLCLSVAPVSAADGPAGPGWLNVQGTPVTPQQADAYYNSVSSSTHDITPESATTITPELTALARSLKNDPKLIYEYVRNNVDYSPYFGSLKGATLTYLESSGNDFDQASLMISLLRASGITAQYVYGTMSIPAYGDPNQNDMQHWLGVDANSSVISTVLANGGIPYTQGSNFSVSRVWVQATISGTNYLFDPAFKPRQTITGINLQTAMNYSKSGLLAAAGGTIGIDYIQNLNEAGLKSTMDGYTLNLANYIRSNYPNARTSEIIGGSKIVTQTLTSLPTSLSFSNTPQYYWTDIPDAYPNTYVHKVRIKHGEIDQTLNIPDLAGQKLSIAYKAGTITTASMEGPAPIDPQLNLAPPVITALDTQPITLTPNLPDSPPLGITMTASAPGENLVQLMSDTTVIFQTIADDMVCTNCWSITLTNPSTNPTLNVNSSITNNSSGAYTISNGGGSRAIAPGGSLKIYVNFSGTGQSRGTKTATFNLDRWYTGYAHTYDTYNYTGIIAESDKVSGTGINFAVSYMNTPSSSKASFTNNGSLPITLTAKTLTGTGAARFNFGSASDYNPITIQPGATQQINITYLANVHGTQSASINFGYTYDGISYSAGDVISLSGSTFYKPDTYTGSTGYGFNLPYLGNPVDGLVRIKNSGSQPLSITGINLTGTDKTRFTITGGNAVGTLAAGQYRDINVRYLANSVGSHTANVSVSYTHDGLSYDWIAHNGVTLSGQDLGLSGQTLSTPVAQLWLDDTMLAEETEPVVGTDLNKLTISIDHPYSGPGGTDYDQLVTHNLKRGATYAIIYDFGGSRLGKLVEKRERQLQTYRESGLADTSRQILTESLNVIGVTWMRDTTLSDNLFAQIAGIRDQRHHRFGVVAQESGYYIDVKAQMFSIASASGNSVNMNAYLKARNFVMSAMEHGVLEQTQVNRPALSTVKLLQINNANGKKVFRVDSANFATIKPQLTNYIAQDLTDFQTSVNNGNTLILPIDGQIALQSWAGKGYIDYKSDGSQQHYSMIIGGDYHGGYGAIKAPVYIPAVYTHVNLNIFPPAITPKIGSGDPVDMATGFWMFDNTDLTLTGGMGGLSLKRSYNSGSNNMKKNLGYGWSHNYHLYAEAHSSSPFGHGQRQPLDGAAMIAASVATLDIMSGTPDLKSWMTGALIGKLGMDNLTNNTVSIHLETDVLSFVKIPDGSYISPPGTTSKLVKNGSLYRVDERFGRTVNFGSDNNVSSVTDADGNSISFTYSGGKLQRVADNFSHSLNFIYTGELLTSVTDSASRGISYGYTGNNLTTYTDPEAKVWTYGYDTNRRITTLKNPRNITTVTNVYDVFGRVQSQTMPRQTGSTTYNLYFSGYRNIEQDGSGRQTIYYFDENKRLLGVENALGQKSLKNYDGQGHVISETDPRGYATSITFDANHNPIVVTDPLGKQTHNTYDSNYHLTDVTNPLGHIASTGYDSEHHPITATAYPASGQSIITRKSYFTNGLVNTTTDGKGVVTTLTQDSYGNPATSKTSTAPIIDYDYDAIGRMTALTDQVGSKTTFSYDKRSLLTGSTDPLNRSISLTYYDDGTLKTKTDRNNKTTTLTYTPTGKINSIAYQGGATVAYTYDQQDNLTKMQDSIGATNYTYDAANRLASSTDPRSFGITYTRDSNGNITKATYPGSKTVSYTYDALNRIKTVTIDWLAKTATYNYDDAGRMTDLTQFNGTYMHYTYDEANRLTALENRISNAGSAISSYNYTLDNNGNRTGITQTVPIGISVAAANTNFTMNLQKNRLIQAGATSFTYDNEGQLATKTGETYAFDDAHRVTGINGSVSHQYKYDGAGNRLEAIRNGVTTRYIYDASGNLLAEADGSNVIQKYYIYGSGLLAVVTSGNQVYNYHFDGTGHTIALTDATANVVNKYAYTPFGAIANQQETISQPFKYVGKYGVMIEPNGLYYMKARYYDSSVGRFVSEDPKSFDGGDVNLMAYVGGNPVMGIDPSGLTLAYGDFYSTFIYQRNVNQIATTQRGAELVNKLQGSKTVYTINAGNAPNGEPAWRENNNAYVNPTFHPTMNTDAGPQVASTTRILAHELGHFTGTRDDGPGRMNNINTWENPIMRPLEGYNRTSYKLY